MNDNYTAILLIVDRSGSMASIKDATQDAINEFIGSQAAQPGEVSIRLEQFDNVREVVFPSVSAKKKPEFELEPRGMTALYDAVCVGIDEFGAELAAMSDDERPASVLVGIMTDGAENASTMHNAKAVQGRIMRQQNSYGWKFLFMGANQDAIVSARNLGLGSNSAITYTASRMGTKSVIGTLNEYAVATASGLSYDITDKDRNEAQK